MTFKEGDYVRCIRLGRFKSHNDCCPLGEIRQISRITPSGIFFVNDPKNVGAHSRDRFELVTKSDNFKSLYERLRD